MHLCTHAQMQRTLFQLVSTKRKFCPALQLVNDLHCKSTEAKKVGRLTVLPVMLSGVLPYAHLDGKALEDLLLSIMQSSPAHDSDATEELWAVQHLQVSAFLNVLSLAVLCAVMT